MGTATFPLAISLVLLALLRLVAGQCGRHCKIRACGESASKSVFIRNGARQLLRPPSSPQGILLCVPNHTHGRAPRLLHRVDFGKIMVKKRGGALVGIAEYNPRGLSRSFPKQYFRPFNGLRAGTAIGRIKNKGNQYLYTKDLCVVIAVDGYTLGTASAITGPTVQNTGGIATGSCVAFTTNTAPVYIHVQYDSLADYDLEIVEPNGFVLSPITWRSPSGGSHKEPKMSYMIRPCQRSTGGKYMRRRRETILYENTSKFQQGRYTIRMVRRDLRCGEPSKFEFRIVLNDRQLIKKNMMNRPGASGNATVVQFEVNLRIDGRRPSSPSGLLPTPTVEEEMEMTHEEDTNTDSGRGLY